MIVLAFANGDRRALRDLLSSEVYESFDAVIKEREKNEQKTRRASSRSTRPNSSVRAARPHRPTHSALRFADDLGHPRQGRQYRRRQRRHGRRHHRHLDFRRDISSRDPNWKLVGTGSAN